MVDNQHRKIAGFSELSEDEITTINAIKANEAKIKAMVDELLADELPMDSSRWLALARHHLEIGFMFAVKAVARPSGQMGSLD